MLFKSITVQGHIVGNLRKQYEGEFFRTIPPLVDSGAIKHIEEKTRGLHAVGQVLLDQQLGKNLGKAVVVLADEWRVVIRGPKRGIACSLSIPVKVKEMYMCRTFALEVYLGSRFPCALRR